MTIEEGADGEPAECHGGVVEGEGSGGGVPAREDVEGFDHADGGFETSPAEFDGDGAEGEEPGGFVGDGVGGGEEDDGDEKSEEEHGDYKGDAGNETQEQGMGILRGVGVGIVFIFIGLRENLVRGGKRRIAQGVVMCF